MRNGTQLSFLIEHSDSRVGSLQRHETGGSEEDCEGKQRDIYRRETGSRLLVFKGNGEVLRWERSDSPEFNNVHKYLGHLGFQIQVP